MTSLGIAIFVAALAGVGAVAYLVLRSLWPVRNMRLMRCPETGAIVFVEARSVPCGEGTAPGPSVQSCELWPERKNCGQGCLERYGETVPGYRVKVEALRPFERS